MFLIRTCIANIIVISFSVSAIMYFFLLYVFVSIVYMKGVRRATAVVVMQSKRAECGVAAPQLAVQY